jgi:D-3-phosphoglycerate dehydrogenase / 2-oxoglutarate reductase
LTGRWDLRHTAPDAPHQGTRLDARELGFGVAARAAYRNMGRKMMIDQAKVRVLLLESIHPDAVSRLEEDGFHVESVRNALDEAELIERIAGVHLLGIRSKTQVN